MNDRQRPRSEDEPISIVYSYAPKDKPYYEALEAHLSLLKSLYLIETWNENNILGGSNPQVEIQKSFQAADIILLLLSADYLASKRCSQQAQLALDLSRQKKTRVVPIVLRPIAGLEMTEFARLKPLPKEKQPLTAWSNREDAIISIAQSIGEIVTELRQPGHAVETLKDAKEQGTEQPVRTTSPFSPTAKPEQSQQGDRAQIMSYFEQGHALLIGINQYQHIPQLSEAVLKDALKLHDVLRNPDICAYRDKNVQLLLNEQASANSIRAGLRTLAQTTGADATAFIYFSGHGLKVSSDGNETFYLLPYESDFANLPQTAITAEELSTLLSQIPARRLLLCLDCCYAEGLAELKGPGHPFPQTIKPLDKHDYEKLAQGAGRVILGAALAHEMAVEKRSLNNSLFTYYLLEALQGKAHVYNDGLIRVMDVFHYISNTMPSHSQHAICISSTQDNFPIAFYREARKENTRQQAQQKGTAVDERGLRKFIQDHFNRSELEILCADIESDLDHDGIKVPVNLDVIGGNGPLPNQILALVNYLKRRGHLDYLVRAVRREFPGVI